jgi:hypothetical protein
VSIRANHNSAEPARDLIKREIENRDTRKELIRDALKESKTAHEPDEPQKAGLGIQCVTIEPGDELGALYLNTQFEAWPGEHADCQAGQERIAIQGGEWLKAFLEQLTDGAAQPDYVVNVHWMPCPGAPPSDPSVVLRNLETVGPVNANTGDVGRGVGTTIKPKPEVKS